MAFSRNGRSKQSAKSDSGSEDRPEPDIDRADGETTDQDGPDTAAPATQDEFDLVGSRVAEILRTADTAAEDRRAEAESYASKVYTEADSLRAKAAEDQAEAERLRHRSDVRLQQAETRLASIETELESAKVQAQELVSSAQRERDAIIQATISEAEDKLTRATRHLGSRVKDIQQNQAEASERLSAALKSLEALEGDLKILDPESVLDLTGPTPSVSSEQSGKSEELPVSQVPKEPALVKTVGSLPGVDTPPAVDSSAARSMSTTTPDDVERGGTDSDAAELRGTVDVTPVAATTDGTWLADVVRTAVSRAMEESDDADDSKMQRF